MHILVKKFGTTLVSRPSGKEAHLAFRPTLQNFSSDEDMIVDFNNVITLTPSWADEFLTPLMQEYGKRVKLVNINNPSVVETLKILGMI